MPEPIPLSVVLRAASDGAAAAPMPAPAAGPSQPGLESDSFPLLAYGRLLRRRQATLLMIGFAGGLLGFLITLPQARVYQAHTSVEIVALNANFLNINQSQVNPAAQTGTVGDSSDLATQAKILASNSMLARAMDRMSAGQAPRPGPEGLLAEWRRTFNLPQDASSARLDAIAMAADTLKVKPLTGSRILDITVNSTDPRLAAEFANVLTSEYIDGSLEARWKTTEHTGQWLASQLEDVRRKLEHSEDEMQAYARRFGLLFTHETTPVSEDKLKQLQQSLSAAQNERISKQSRFEMTVRSAPDTLPEVLGDDSLREYQNQITELRRQVAEASGTLTGNHPRIRQLHAQIAIVRAALEGERAAIVQRVRNEYDEAKRKEKLLSETYTSQAAQVSGDSEKEIRYNLLKREVDSNRQLYDAMLQQLKQSTIAAAFRASNIQVVDVAKPPLQAYRPNVLQSSGLGLVLGTLFGAAFIVLRERADRTLQEPGETGFYLQVPELGVVPSALSDPASPLAPAALSRQVQLDSDAAGQENPATGLRPRVELVTWQRRRSMLSEAYRSSLVSILFSARNGVRPKVLVLTSPGPNEGKSTVASNLSIAISEMGRKVLLIDADMRKPRVHQIFGLEAENGLSELLRARPPLLGDSALDAFIQPTEVPELFVITSGKKPPSPTSILSSAYTEELLRYLRQRFDTILIDTPPMLQLPDARVIGRRADTVILVVRAEKTTRDAALAARHRFFEDGTQVLGTILYDWNPKTSGSYYGYSKGYYTTYSHYQERQNASAS